jgi:hypothetical protein
VDPHSGILKRGREIVLTGCYLRTAREGAGPTRLLPTEYLVILLDDVTANMSFSVVFSSASVFNGNSNKNQLLSFVFIYR